MRWRETGWGMRGPQHKLHFYTGIKAACGVEENSFLYGGEDPKPEQCCRKCLKVRGGVL